jgi:uncharacterized membrane protein YbhN (UPF0104 family)
MKRILGGDVVGRGLYWDKETWKLILIGRDGQILAGDTSHIYFRVNAIEAIILALIMSVVYVMFIPTLGLATVLGFVLFTAFLFFSQKVTCRVMRWVCATENWLCKFIHAFLCKQCGINCEEDAMLMARAFGYTVVGMIFFSLGVWLRPYLQTLNLF